MPVAIRFVPSEAETGEIASLWWRLQNGHRVWEDRWGVAQAVFAGAVGLLMIGMGAYLFADTRGWINWPANWQREVFAPQGVLDLVSAVFAVLGLYVVCRSIAEAFVAAEGERPEHAEPWRRDHDWPESEFRDDTATFALRGGVEGAILALFLLPFHYAFLYVPLDALVRALLVPNFKPMEAALLPAGGIVLFFDALVVPHLWRLAVAVWHWLRFGRSRFVARELPFRLGEAVWGDLVLPPNLPRIGRVRLMLCCIEQLTEAPDRQPRAPMSFPFVLRWGRTFEADLPEGSAPSHRLSVELPLPEDAPPTHLSGRPRILWGIVVEVRGVRPRYVTSFLLPVYSNRTLV